MPNYMSKLKIMKASIIVWYNKLMMSLEELREKFLVQDKYPTTEEFTKKKFHSAVPIIIEDKAYVVILRNERESRIYTYLQSPNDYKVKEDLFGIIIEKGYAYSTTKGIPTNLQLVLPKKWIIEDSKIKRELEVVVTDIDQKNDQLLHELYTKTRDKK